MLKNVWSIGLLFVFCLTLLASNIFACACCAERGHYSIRTSKPDQYIFDVVKNVKLTSANLYTDAGFPDNIKGINPLSDDFTASNNFSGNLWSVDIKDNLSKTGKLNLLRPISMVEYMVDQNPSEEEISGVTLYKEWRFKYKVDNATGIFQTGFDKNTEYFLVLQGKGNVCTNPEDFSHYRLEITGKNAKYMFFGKVNSDITSNNNEFKLGALTGDYSGCSCSAQTDSESKKSGEWKTFNFYDDLEGTDRSAYFNIDGKDVKFPMIKKGKQSDEPKIGDKHTDVYEKDGITISIEYIVKELPCDECEGTDYDVTITARKGDKVVTEKGKGSCGC